MPNYRAPRNANFLGLPNVSPVPTGISNALLVRHPKQVGILSTVLSAFAGSFFFVFLLNLGTGLFAEICTIPEKGAASAICSYVPAEPRNAQQVGMHPEYAGATGGLVLAVMIAASARYVAQHIAGLWGQGDIDLWFTIIRMAKAMVTRDEHPMYVKRLLAMIAQGAGAFLAVTATWGFLQSRSSYRSGAEGLGGPGVATYGLQSVLRTHFLVVAICAIRGLLFLWANVENKWTTQVGKDDAADPVMTGVTHHAKAGLLAFGDAALVAVTGKIFGTGIGFFWRDLASLAIQDHRLLDGEPIEGFSLYLLTTAFAAAGYLISLAIVFAMLYAIRMQVNGIDGIKRVKNP